MTINDCKLILKELFKPTENIDIFDKYFNLIENNLKTKRENFKTQRHHIVPKCIWKRISRDFSCDLIVNLTHKNHILAHYYLYKLANNSYLKVKLGCALTTMCKKNNCRWFDSISENELITVLEDIDYDNLLIEINRYKSENLKGKVVSQEIKNKMKEARRKYLENLGVNPRTGTKHTEETKRKIGLANKGKVRTVEQRKNISDSHKGQIPWNKGVHYNQSSEAKRKRKKMFWFTNGIIDVKAECQPEGFIKGRAVFSSKASLFQQKRKIKMSNKIWLCKVQNDKISTIFIDKDKINVYINKGWQIGRKPR